MICPKCPKSEALTPARMLVHHVKLASADSWCFCPIQTPHIAMRCEFCGYIQRILNDGRAEV